MNTPKVSVIIPVYNAEAYLTQCITSIQTQTLKNIEIICVDDGSTDTSPQILEHLQRQDDRIRILTQANASAGAARNNGLRHARGEFLSFLDADDFFEPDMLEKAVASAETYSSDFVVFQSDQYLMNTEAFHHANWVLRLKDIPPYMPFSYRQLTGNVFKTFTGWAWDKLYRRSFVLENNLWFQEQRTSNDLLFVFSALILAKRISIVTKILAHQRRGGLESLSVTRERSWHCFYDALTALRQRLQTEDIYWELEKDFINYALHFSLWNLNTLAEPTHSLLKATLLDSWFTQLDITHKPQDYFYDAGEYANYLKLLKEQAENG